MRLAIALDGKRGEAPLFVAQGIVTFRPKLAGEVRGRKA
jgi:hypothetical protein